MREKRTPMRIAINAWFIDQPTTGSGQYLTHLLAEYAARYPEHSYLLCGHARQVVPWMPEHLPGLFEWRGLHTPFDRVHRHLDKLWFEQIGFPLVCRRWRADVMHVPYWASPAFPPVPTVVTIHDLIPLLHPAYQGGRKGRWYTRLVALSARRAAHVLTDSEASRRDIAAHLHIPADRVQAIYLAADERFRPVADPAELNRVRARYALPDRYLLYLGGFDVRKNVPGILRAFARLDAPDVHLVIAGRLPGRDTSFFPDPRRIAGELALLDRVRFTGWVDEDDKPALYSGAIAFAFPSQYEGFGLPPLEAMACGTPVIVSDRSSLPEVAGEGGLRVDPGDPEALASAMKRVVSDTTLCKELRQAALSQAGRFRWHRTAQQTMMAYAHLATVTAKARSA